MDYKKILETEAYDVLRTDPHLGANICYLTIGGSRAYGTNNENSDVDIRGVFIERPSDIFGSTDYEQYDSNETDTVIYSLRKFIHLCQNCNPNVIEMLGTKEDHILYQNELGKSIRNHAELFLSKRAYYTFAGYATAQLRRLKNALAHDSYPEDEKAEHIRQSLESMMHSCEEQYHLENGSITFFVDGEEGKKDIYTDVAIRHVSLRRFISVNNAMASMLRNYDKLNHRNSKKDEAHLRKHAMHLIRLYLMGIDILRGSGINTYRSKEHNMLLDIRSGKISLDEVFKMQEEYDEEMKAALKASKLPEYPDTKAIESFQVEMYKKYLKW